MHLLVDNDRQMNIWWSAKCGCSFVKNLYYTIVLKKEISDIHSRETYAAIYDHRNKNFLNLYVCRNPYARIVSSFAQKLELYPEYTSFEGFVDLLYDHYVNRKNVIKDVHHTTPQFSELFPFWDNNFYFHDIVKLEELDRVDLLDRWFDIQTEKKPKNDFGYNMNVQKNKHTVANAFKLSRQEIIQLKKDGTVPYYTSFYNDKIKQKIDRIYRIDFKMFEKYGIHYKLE